MTTEPTWTPERIEILTRMRAEGYSASQIGVRLGGLTRCAVLGKAKRLGLAPRKPSPKRSPRPRMPREAKPKPERVHSFKVPKLEPPLPPDSTPPVWAKPLLELEPNECRFPYGEENFLFCAAPAEAGLSYCASHCRVCYGRQQVERITARRSNIGYWPVRAAG
jgi:GcrA cell cycle regulator